MRQGKGPHEGDHEDPVERAAESTQLIEVIRRFAARSRLSERETEVLRNAAVGRSMKQAAASLGLSPKTVEDYWSRIYAKTGNRSQLEVVASLLQTALR